MSYKIKLITDKNADDLQLKNESFDIFGKLKVSFENEAWNYTTEDIRPISSMTFPDENYQLEDINAKGFALAAYLSDECVGLAVMENSWFKYLYLSDLKVSKSARGTGIGRALIMHALELARKAGYNGIYTIGQDNNLAACRFYLKTGFVIGGLNTLEYHHTSQADKANIYFYLD